MITTKSLLKFRRKNKLMNCPKDNDFLGSFFSRLVESSVFKNNLDS